MKTTKLSTEYLIQYKDKEITCSINENKSVTVKRADGELEFVFKNSNPKTLRTIGEMLIEASTLTLFKK
jgi:hypothetical protein